MSAGPTPWSEVMDPDGPDALARRLHKKGEGRRVTTGPRRVLIFGGRDCVEADVERWLDETADHALGPISCVIHGGARGADRAAGRWAKRRRFKVEEYKADWKRYGKSAGPIRNAQMLREGKPDVGLAFPGGNGTADMTDKLRAAGVPVIRSVWIPGAPLVRRRPAP